MTSPAGEDALDDQPPGTVAQLRGVSGSKVRQSRDWVLTEMVRDFFGNESMVDVPPDLDEPGKVAWARAGLLQIVDAEVARLQMLRESFDPAAQAEIRSRSVDLALFDPSKELTLARKYEAAAERSLYKAIKEFREAEADAVAAGRGRRKPRTGRGLRRIGFVRSDRGRRIRGRGAETSKRSSSDLPIVPIADEIAPEVASGVAETGRSGPV